jgi:hypothetical protein
VVEDGEFWEVLHCGLETVMRVLGATGRVLVVLEVVEDGDTVVAGLEVAVLASD